MEAAACACAACANCADAALVAEEEEEAALAAEAEPEAALAAEPEAEAALAAEAEPEAALAAEAEPEAGILEGADAIIEGDIGGRLGTDCMTGAEGLAEAELEDDPNILPIMVTGGPVVLVFSTKDAVRSVDLFPVILPAGTPVPTTTVPPPAPTQAAAPLGELAGTILPPGQPRVTLLGYFAIIPFSVIRVGMILPVFTQNPKYSLSAFGNMDIICWQLPRPFWIWLAIFFSAFSRFISNQAEPVNSSRWPVFPYIARPSAPKAPRFTEGRIPSCLFIQPQPG